MPRVILLANAVRKPSNSVGAGDLFLGDTSRRSRWRASLTGITVAAVLAAAGILAAAAPAEATPPTNPITLPERIAPQHDAESNAPQALRAIQRAMRGETGLRTDDPVLQPLLQLLGDKSRRRRSPEKLPSRRELLGGEQTSTGEAVWQSPSRSEIARGGGTDPRWRAAESLLKAARLIEQLEPADENRQELVNRMRQEAVRILAQIDLSAEKSAAESAPPPHSVSLPSPDE